MLFKRVITVIIAAPFVVWVIFYPRTEAFKAFVAACLAVSLWEYFSIIGFLKKERLFAVGLGLAHTVFLLFFLKEVSSLLFEGAGLVLLIFGAYCLSPKQSLEGVAERIALILLGSIYIGGLGSFMGFCRDLPDGIFWVLLAFGMTWFNDTFAYFAGHWFGRRRMAPLISPQKTLAGFFAGYLGSAAAFFLLWSLMKNPLSWQQGLILSVLVGTVSPIGDLSESMLKRSFHIKDSGHVIPGHGGMLDRMDALLFTFPVVYWFASTIIR